MNQILFSYIGDTNTQRLDAFLAIAFPQFSRRQWRVLCLDKKIKINQRISKPGVLLSYRDSLCISKDIFYKQLPENFIEKVSLVYEDEDLIIVNKLPEIHSVSIKTKTSPSVADWISYHCKKTIEASNNPLESGLLNRLDFYTSGLLFAAKNKQAWQALKTSQEKGVLSKEYQALCEGELKRKKFTIVKNLKQNSNGSKMLLASEKSKSIETKTEVLDVDLKSNGVSLVSLGGASFVRHQLRVHMSAIGHPLVGDEKYDSKSKLKTRKGFFLHSKKLSLIHPKTEKRMFFEKDSKELRSLI